MFVQVIVGKVGDAERARDQIEAWVKDVSPGSVGWLGSTGGVTEDGELVEVVRFASEESAHENSDLSAQGAWWDEMSKVFSGEPAFYDSVSCDVDTPGDPSKAGFVQVMQGRSTDLDRARELMRAGSGDMAALRPDVVGTVYCGHKDGDWTMVLYFTSEADAREGERREPTPEMAKMMEELNALSTGEPTFFDLKDPWFHAPS